MPFNRPPLRDLMRRGSFLAEEVLLGSNARRGSLFASVVKQQGTTDAPAIAKVHLFSSLMFVVGSVFFVAAEFRYHDIPDTWLFHYRIGSAFYIIGCIGYLVAMGMSGSLQDGLSGRLSDAMIILAMVLFILGCAMAFTPGGQQKVNQYMDMMNRIYLAGSLLLFFDAIKCAVSSRLAEGLTLGNYLDIATTLSFTVAAVVGGQFYKTTPYVVKEGISFWLVGSCFCIVGPLRVVACGAYDHDVLPRRAYDQDVLPRMGGESVYGAMHAAPDGHRTVVTTQLDGPSVKRKVIDRSRSPTPVSTPRGLFYPVASQGQVRRTSSLPDDYYAHPNDSSSDGKSLPRPSSHAQASRESSSDGYYSSCEDGAKD